MYGYNRSSCYSCQPCKDRNYSRCDSCSAQCCQNNMNSHREIFDLSNDFNYKVEYAIRDLRNKCGEIKNNLNYHNIYIYQNLYDLNDCQSFLSKMRDKKYEIKNSKKYNENLFSNLNQTNQKSLNLLKKEHEEKLEKLKNKFIENEKEYTKDNKIQDNQINEKKKEKKILENNKNEINRDNELILNNYGKEEREKAEIEFKKNINDIDKKYIYTEEKLDYTENELKLMKQYKNEIEKLKKYSDNPFYNNFIISCKLNKYLN